MNRRLKIISAVLAVLFLGFLAISLLIAKFFPYSRLKQAILAEAQNQLHRQVRIGKISWGIFKGLTIHDFAISEPPDFSKGTFARFSSSNLRVSWRALLKKKIVISGISLEDFGLVIKKNRNGDYNFSDLVSTSSSSRNPAPIQKAPVPNSSLEKILNVRRLSIANGDILYQDAQNQDQIRLTRINLDSSGLRLGAPFYVALSFDAAGPIAKRPINARLSYRGDLNIKNIESKIISARFTSLSVQNGPFKIDASGHVAWNQGLKADIQSRLFYKNNPLLALKWNGIVQGPWDLAKVQARGKINLRTPELNSSDIPRIKVSIPLAIAPLNLAGHIHLKNDLFSTPDAILSSTYGSIHFAGKISHVFGKSPKPNISFTAALKTPGIEASKIPGVQFPKGLEIPALTIKAQGSLRKEILTLAPLQLQASPGSLTLFGSLKPFPSKTPIPKLKILADLHFPQVHSSEIPWAHLSRELTLPASNLKASIDIDKNTLTISRSVIETKLGTLGLSGPIEDFMSQKPQPQLAVSAAITLPAFHSSDIPMKFLPQGIRFPVSRWNGSFFLSRDDVQIKNLSIAFKRNQIEFSKTEFKHLAGKKPTLKTLVRCPAFDLPEIAPIFPQTRKLKLLGRGFFALSAIGPLERPIVEGKLKFQDAGITGMGFDASGFSGVVSFNDIQIKAPDISGRLDGQKTRIDLTVKNYAQRPAIDFESHIARLDIDRFLKAEKIFSAKAASLTTPGAPDEKEKPRPPMDAQGTLTIGKVTHPKFKANDVRIHWYLTGVSSNIRKLNGWAKISASRGRLKDLGQAANKSILIKTLSFPIIVIQKITSFGGIRLFPNFNDIRFKELVGDYVFLNGVMSINDSHVYSDAANVAAKGKIDIPSQNIDMRVTAQIANIAPMDISVKGPLDKPKIHVDLKDLLLGPAKDILNDVFGK